MTVQSNLNHDCCDIADITGSMADPKLPYHAIFSVASPNLQGPDLSTLSTLHKDGNRYTFTPRPPKRHHAQKGQKKRNQILPSIGLEPLPDPDPPDGNPHIISETLSQCGEHGVDILCTQECPSTKATQRNINRCLPEYITTLHTGPKDSHKAHNSAPSTGIISHKKSSGPLASRWKGLQGRLTTQTFSLGEHSPYRTHTRLVVLSVYGPTGVPNNIRDNFWNKVIKKISELRQQKKLIILASDFNLAPSSIDVPTQWKKQKRRTTNLPIHP